MHLACRTTGPTSSGALDRRGVETPNLHAQKIISFILESPMKCKWQKGIKRKPSYIGCYGCPPVRSIVQKLLFHIEMRFEGHNFLRERWSPWKICQGFCHIPTVYAVSPSDSKRFFRKSQPSTWKEVTRPLASASNMKDNGVDRVSQTQEQPFAPVTSSWYHPVASTLRNIFLAIPTWDNMGRPQTYGSKKWECQSFPESQCNLVMSRKLRHIHVLFIHCTPVPQPPKHLDAGASPAQDFARSQVRLNSFVRVAPDILM